MDPDPDPAFFVIDRQDANKKLIFLLFSAPYFLKVHLRKKERKKECIFILFTPNNDKN
jgi:hypothetical protein